MGKDSGSSSSVNPDEVAQAQARYNRINQTTPFGSLKFSGQNRNKSTITLSPEQQALLDQQQRNQAMAGALAGGQLGSASDIGSVRQATLDRAMALLEPQYADQAQVTATRLANQGLAPTDRAYAAETGILGNAQALAREQAALGSVLAGGAEQANQIQGLLSLLGYAQPGEPTFFAPGSVTYPIDQGDQGGFSAQGTLAGVGTGASTGAAFGPWGALIGGGAGGLLGSGLLGR